ncbi:MAG: ribosomal-processing cysteine protease Prp [bacterium]|nr:ribosomal-processing cysteine protease Prp [bacterium]
MIHADFIYHRQKIIGFKITGHSDLYRGIKGRLRYLFLKSTGQKDYICSAVSAVSYMTVIGLGRIEGRRIEFRTDEAGFMECKLKDKPDGKSELLFRTLLRTLEEMIREYPGHIDISNTDTEEKHGA